MGLGAGDAGSGSRARHSGQQSRLETTLSEYFEVPFNEPRAKVNGFGPRGMDIDRNGVV